VPPPPPAGPGRGVAGRGVAWHGEAVGRQASGLVWCVNF